MASNRKLNKYEKEILTAYELGELKTTKNKRKLKKSLKEAAESHLKKGLQSKY